MLLRKRYTVCEYFLTQGRLQLDFRHNVKGLNILTYCDLYFRHKHLNTHKIKCKPTNPHSQTARLQLLLSLLHSFLCVLQFEFPPSPPPAALFDIPSFYMPFLC